MLGKWTPRRVLNARTLAWSVVLMALAAGPGVSAATGATTPDPKRRLISLRVYYNGSGTYTRTVPDGCDGGPQQTDASFHWRNAYEKVAFVPASLSPQSTNVNLVDGVRVVSGSWSKTCGPFTAGTIADADDAGGTSQLATTVRARLTGDVIELQVEALYQLGDPDRNKLFFLGKSGGCCSFGPFSGPSDSVTSTLVAIVRVPLAQLAKLKFGKPDKIVETVGGPIAPWAFLNCGAPCTDSVSWTGTVEIQPGCPNSRTDPGYDGLSAAMKAALNQLYFELDRQQACYSFTSGHRSQEAQDKVRKRWHDIADQQGNSDKRSQAQVCTQLKAAGFAQCPASSGGQWRSKSGVANGGPAKNSRHTSKDAADVTVLWPPGYQRDLGRYQAAARKAGLCGPPAGDPVHVELPYVPKGKHGPKRCWFPPGPAP